MMGSVHVSQFFDDPSSVPESLKQRTMGELVELGASGIKALSEVSDEEVDQILRIVARFLPAEGDDSLLTPESNPQESSQNSDDPESPARIAPRRVRELPEVIPLSSVESAKRLSAGFQKLRSRSDLHEFRVDEFWNEDLISAPFLQELTVRELSEMNVDFLLKKRSVGNRKIIALLDAIDRALSHQPSAPPPSQAERPQAAVHFLWEPLPSESSSLARAVVQAFENDAQLLSHSGKIVPEFMRTLPEWISQQELTALQLLTEGKQELITELLPIERDEIESCLERASERVRAGVHERFPELLDQWETLLQGEGASEKTLFFMLLETEVQEASQKDAARLLLTALGAERVDGRWKLSDEA